MDIIINGSRHAVPAGHSISKVVSDLGFSMDHVAIEYNGRVLEKSEFDGIAIRPEDQIEIVRFVGGG